MLDKGCRYAKQAAKKNSPPTKHVHHQTKGLKVLQVKPMAKKEQMMMRFKSNYEPTKVVAMHRGSQQWLCYEKEITTELSRYFRFLLMLSRYRSSKLQARHILLREECHLNVVHREERRLEMNTVIAYPS
ncbi:hypothetical protein AKJ16_DCAP17568 [Drosera capensis]